MALDPVPVGAQGFAYVAPVGTAAPTTDVDVWPSGWFNLGLISQDGLVESAGETVTPIQAWGKASAVRNIITAKNRTWKFTLIQLTAWGLALWDNVALDDMTVSGTAPDQFLTYDDANSLIPLEFSFGVDVIDGDRHIRKIMPVAQVGQKDDITYSQGASIGFGLTISAISPDVTSAAVKTLITGVTIPTIPAGVVANTLAKRAAEKSLASA